MDKILEFCAAVFLVAGGIMTMLSILGVVGWAMCQIWAAFSNRFRDVCRAESLIHEYRRNRVEFLFWKTERERVYEDG